MRTSVSSPDGRRLAAAALLAALMSTPAFARTIAVAPQDNLQQVLRTARPGDVITLENGAVYSGNFVLPQIDGGGDPVVIRPARLDGLPRAGERVSPDHARLLPRLRSPNGAPALRTAPGASGWRVELLEMTIMPGGSGEIVALGDGSSSQRHASQVPHHLTIDRCYIHGEPGEPQKRCVALNSAHTTVTGSYIADCKAVGQDSQAIAGWNGPGPFTISNNYLAGAGENILFGGADPSIPDLVPSDISITGNLIEKPLAWRNSRWEVKNLLELKNARRVTISGNVIRHNWQAAQSGWSILLTVRNQDGRCPWCQVAQVTIERNRIEQIAAGISILGADDEHPSQRTTDIVIRHNLVRELDSRAWGGSGYFLLLLGGPLNVTVASNTIIQPHASGLVQVEGPPVRGFVFRGNLATHGEYGIIGTGRGPGRDTLDAYFPGARVEGNVIAGADGGRYPGGNAYPARDDFDRQFVDAAKGDYRLKATARWGGAAGQPPGADLSTIPEP